MLVQGTIRGLNLHWSIPQPPTSQQQSINMGRLIPNKFNLLVVIYVALGSTACSYSLAVTGSTIGQPTFYTSLGMVPPGEPGYTGTANLISAFNGVNAAGAFIGSLFTSWSANFAGRKRTIQLGCGIMIIGAAVTAGAVDPAMFIVGRLISGLATGLLVTSIPMYQSEVATPESRGFMCCMHGVMVRPTETDIRLTRGSRMGLQFLESEFRSPILPHEEPC